jgi:hypothetical protein
LPIRIARRSATFARSAQVETPALAFVDHAARQGKVGSAALTSFGSRP